MEINAREIGIPPATLRGIKDYLQRHCEPGGFLLCVLENDLMGAFARADKENRAALGMIVDYLTFYALMMCWGKRDKVAHWLRMKGSAAA